MVSSSNFQEWLPTTEVMSMQKFADFERNWAFPDCHSSSNSPSGFEMIYKALSSIEQVPYFLSRSSIKFQGHTGQKITNFAQIERFWTVTAVWIHHWVWNDAQSLMYFRRGALMFFVVIHQIWRSQAIKSLRFALFGFHLVLTWDPIWTGQ